MSTIYNENCLDIFKIIPNESIDLVVTDPPYRVISGGHKSEKWKSGYKNSVLYKNDGKIFDYNDIKFEDWVPEIYRVLKENSHCYIMTNVINMENLLRVCRETGFKLHNILVWEKNTMNTNRWYMKNCEFTLFLYKGKAKTINNPSSKQVHKFDNIVGNKNHPTEKPLDLMKLYISNSSDENDIILDPFMGSGTTGLACKELNRDFIGIEIDENYYHIAQKRLFGIDLSDLD